MSSGLNLLNSLDKITLKAFWLGWRGVSYRLAATASSPLVGSFSCHEPLPWNSALCFGGL